jgi:hypothetical protein
MARPKKNYCDYFPHDRDMRNHRKVKAIRTKFGPIGYAIWSMTLEYLTGIDGNVFEYSDVEFELMAGDFGVSATEIREVVDYCIKLEMIFLNNGFINSESLDERLKPVYEKRGTNKDKSKKQLRINGKFASNNTASNGVSAPEMPQSKVNKSKVKETKLKFSHNISLTESENEKLVSEYGEDIVRKCYDYLSSYKVEKSYSTKSDYLTIRRWVLDAVNKPNKTVSPQNSVNPYQQQLEAARMAYKTISE